MDAPTQIALGLIYPGVSRAVDRATVKALAASMDAIGLQTPITVRPTTRPTATGHIDAYEIVAGRHRYEAALQLKWTRINCVVQAWDDDDAALWEIDENLIRAELSDAQRAEHHARRRDIMVRKGLVSAPGKGGDRRSTAKSAIGPSYAKQAANSLGVSERTVRQDLARGSKIAPDVLAAIAGTPEDKGVVLDRLAKTPTEKQPEALAQIRAEAEAPRPSRAEPVVSLSDRQAEPILRAWNAAPAAGRERFLELIGATLSQRSVA